MKTVAVLLLLAGPAVVVAEPTEPWVEDIGSPQFFALDVENIDRSVKWYSMVFGLEAIGGSQAKDGAWQIENLRNDRLFVELVRDNRSQKVDRAQGFSKVGFYVPDVTKVADRVERATGERPRVLDFEQFRQRLLQLRDPDGNIIQLFSSLD